MTSENSFNTNHETSTTEEEKPTIEVKEEEEETVALAEEKQTNIENSDSNGEQEKQDVSSKSESETTDNEMDAQPLFEQTVILEGKRSRKPTLRLEISEFLPTKKELSIPQGHGTPLGEIEYINYQISHASTDTLSRMRYICFGRRGNKSNIRKHLREFKGYDFERNSDEYEKYLRNLIKLKNDQLRSISSILGLPSTGRNTDHAERILNFLIEPIDEGKRIPKRKSTKRPKKKRTITSKESMETDQKLKKQKIRTSNDDHGLDDIYKADKKSSKKRTSNHSTSTDIKSETGTSTESKVDEIVKEEADQKEVIMNDAVQDII